MSEIQDQLTSSTECEQNGEERLQDPSERMTREKKLAVCTAIKNAQSECEAIRLLDAYVAPSEAEIVRLREKLAVYICSEDLFEDEWCSRAVRRCPHSRKDGDYCATVIEAVGGGL